MALFTTGEADACVMARCEAVTKDGSHDYYVFGVIDADGNYYDWIDATLAEGATDVQVKAAVHAHLIAEVDKQPAPSVYSATTDNDIIGDTLV